VRVASVDKSFVTTGGGKVRVFAGLSANFPVKKCSVILGPSGCGKTTLLNMLGGLLKPDRGTILAPKQWNSSGYMFQRDRLLPWRTVYRNALLGAEIRRLLTEELKGTAENWLNRLALEAFVQSYPIELSEGMKQRVALVRTLLPPSDLLLLDEPFASLDYDSRIVVERLLLEVFEQRSQTSVLVTHDVESALVLADRVFIIGRKGTLEETRLEPIPRSGTPDPLDIRRHPRFFDALAELTSLVQ